MEHTIYTKRFDLTSVSDVTEDFILPDYVPEIRRVVGVRGVAAVDGKYLSGDELECDGGITYTVLYTDNDGKLCQTSQTSSFTARALGRRGACYRAACSRQMKFQRNYSDAQTGNKDAAADLLSYIYAWFHFALPRRYRFHDDSPSVLLSLFDPLPFLRISRSILPPRRALLSIWRGVRRLNCSSLTFIFGSVCLSQRVDFAYVIANDRTTEERATLE